MEQGITKYEQEVRERQEILKVLKEKDTPLTENEEILKMQTTSFSNTYQNMLESLHVDIEGCSQ